MHSVLKKLVLALSIILLAPASAYCEQLNPEQILGTRAIQNKIAVVQDLLDHNLITRQEAEKASNFYCEQVTQIVGHTVKAEQISALTAEAKNNAGFGVFLNSVIILAGFILLLSGIGLITYYLRDILKSLPSSFYECASYIATGFLLSAGMLGKSFSILFLTIDPLWFVVPGAFAFAGCVNLSYYLHWRHPHKAKTTNSVEKQPVQEVFFGPGFFTFPTVLFALCTLVWGGMAICYHQAFPQAGIPHFIAFIAVMALQSFLGFSVITAPGCIALGWGQKDKVPKSTLASFILLVAYLGTILSGTALPEATKLFQTGCLFMGAFVYYLGLLVMSNKWYCWPNSYKFQQKLESQQKNDSQEERESQEKRLLEMKLIAGQQRTRYLIMQAITIISGVAAFYIGNSFHIGSLLGIGGTFFVIYLLEKYYEIPWKGVGWAWSLLGVAIALYFFVGFAGQHPQYFIWGIH